jgi:hypothetical protein
MLLIICCAEDALKYNFAGNPSLVKGATNPTIQFVSASYSAFRIILVASSPMTTLWGKLFLLR